MDSTRSHARRKAGSVLLLLLGAIFAPLNPAAAAALGSVSVDGNAITLAFDTAVDGASGFLLDAPRRLAVDVAGLVPGAASASGGPIIQTRVGQVKPGIGRVVFDLSGPTVVRSASLSDDRKSLVLRLADASPRAFAAATRAGRTVYGGGSSSAGGATLVRTGLTVPLDEPKPYQLAIPPVAGRADKPLVVIDAGHGGHDPGSLSIDGKYREKDASLAIAKAVRNALLASGRVRVAMTRSDDRFLVLSERREIARRLHADLFISIHCDSAPGSNASGATVYTLSEVSSDRVAAKLAAKENKADILNGVNLDKQSNDVSSILIDLTQRETMNTSSRFADLLQRELTDQRVDFKTTYHRFAGLAVLKAPDVPAVLLETGYMSSPEDLRLLFSKDYQHRLAVGVTHAVEAHFARRLGRTDIAMKD
ncbi:MAG: N-acetylmuramoyl-L-alanine amidase [Sphingomonas oligoaromativorans]|jgi:N-acetylmuramoyl-L-alanine amidase|uniref:N-acetylmuramoyl-L-alanine amidase n=1 Tax=Sphingomonas oligoaromativorans TaxID=575322 RepID=UPI00142492A7|nr:N-acetylmuramoyl-L-alanine amidase [Sphingomonas oligoaromativorans]